MRNKKNFPYEKSYVILYKLTELRAKANKYIVLRGAGKWRIPCVRKKGEKHHETCKDIKYQEITEHNQKRRLRRVPDILPVCMQNILYSRKPELRAQIRFELVQPGMHSMVKIVHMSAGYAIMASYKMTV